jgi:hypothetical protein
VLGSAPSSAPPLRQDRCRVSPGRDFAGSKSASRLRGHDRAALPRCRTTQLGGLRRSLARSGGAEGDVAPWLVSTSDAANSKQAANPGCFCSSNLRTYSMFSIACLIDFIDISSPIVVSCQYIPEPVMAGLAGGSAPGCGSRCRRVGSPARCQPGVIGAEFELSLGSRSLQSAAPVEARAGPLVCVYEAPQGYGFPGTDVDRALVPSPARPEPARQPGRWVCAFRRRRPCPPR